MERLRASHTRIGHILACWQIERVRIHLRYFACALAAELERRRVIGASLAAQRARRNVLPCNTLAGNTCEAKQVRFQIYKITGDVGDFRTAYESERIAALVGILKLHGQLRIRKHAEVLLVTDRRHVRGSNVIPIGVPGLLFTT